MKRLLLIPEVEMGQQPDYCQQQELGQKCSKK